jgi:hypothetical protein
MESKVLSKNTFIEVVNETADHELFRTVSDQTHTRKYKREESPIYQPAIIEECPIYTDQSVSFHASVGSMGILEDGNKLFTKTEFDGRLSMVTESEILKTGKRSYLVELVTDISAADGFGFVFHNQLPCKKNIKLIDSIFISKKGHVCTRIHELPTVKHSELVNLEKGMIIGIEVDMDTNHIHFYVFDQKKILLANSSINFQETTSLLGLHEGFFCAVLKHRKTTIRFLADS